MSAQEAAEELGVSPATLYAYVSRGLVRSEASEGKTRARLYHADDIQRLKERQELRRNPAKIAEKTLHWGVPVLDSAITLIQDGRCYYRGHDVVELAATRTFEEVAALIWLDDLTVIITGLQEAALLPPQWEPLRPGLMQGRLIDSFHVLLPLVAANDFAAYDLRPSTVLQTAARILRSMSAVAADSAFAPTSQRRASFLNIAPQSLSSKEETLGNTPLNRRFDNILTIAQTLQQSWVPEDPHAVALVNAALILCADHELNVSSFVARCVASAGATPYAVVAAGLSALQGIKHGGHTERVEALLREAQTPAGIRLALTSRLRRGEEIPGFGHHLYPNGDPRGKALLEMIAQAYPSSEAVELVTTLVSEVTGLIDEHPNIDLGLVALAQVLGLPAGGALGLFAIGRTVGWIGHALEEYASDRMIRPRAHYVGPKPVK
jgi:citrate synthase